jgi:hypothetical protein
VASDLLDAYGASVAVLGLHGNDVNEIPWTAARRTYYTFFAGYPTWLIDGLIDSWSGNPPWSSWDPDTAARLAIPTDVTIELAAQEGATADEWHVTATVCIEPGGAGKSMRIYLAEVLDNFPVGAHFTRNGLRQVADTEDIVLAAGACTDVMRTFMFDATTMAQIEDVAIIGWAQDDLTFGPAEVFQAGQMNWPFWTEHVFSDGFESGDTTAWSSTTP